MATSYFDNTPASNFKFAFSAVATPDVGHKPYLRAFRDGVVARLQNVQFSSSLGGLVAVPTICDPAMVKSGDFRDFVSYMRSGHDALRLV